MKRRDFFIEEQVQATGGVPGMLIAGDVGGTKTSLAVYSRKGGMRQPLFEKMYYSADYDGLENMVSEFMETFHVVADDAVFGVAGPVVGARATTTNLPWVITVENLVRTLHLKSTTLLNDLEAVAYGVPLLSENDVCMINEGKERPGGTVGVIAPGTGLGEAFLISGGTGLRAHASEGGHTDFAPAGDREIELLRYLVKKYGHVSYERVCSGRAIPDIYEFLKAAGFGKEPAWLAAELSRSEDATQVIVHNALDPKERGGLCRKTLDLFISILGAEAGNLALKVMATGGIFIGGGIAPRIIPLIREGPFMEAFTHKGRFARFMEGIPVRVILNPRAALMGAAFYGMEHMNS